jgi:NTP pyrophosphatase (non-canonical NTP hydrolase)
MEIKTAQNKIKNFDIARGWENDWNLKDLALNITEEVGEFWSLIKWVGDEKQKEIIKSNKEEASDFIGDTLFLLLKLSNQMDIDASLSLQKTLDEYEKRMPPEIMKKVGHANKLAGGHDNKEFYSQK